MAIIFMKCTKATLFSLQIKDLQAKEIKEAYGEIEYSEEVAGFQIKEKCSKMISIH